MYSKEFMKFLFEYQKEDGKFCILLVKPGDATITVWMFEDKKIYQEKFLLHVVGEPVDAKDIIAAMKNSAGNTQGAGAQGRSGAEREGRCEQNLHCGVSSTQPGHFQ